MTAFVLIGALFAAGALLFVVPPLLTRREVADSSRGAARPLTLPSSEGVDWLS